MTATTLAPIAPFSDVLGNLLERLRASKAGHFVAPRPSELTPRRRQAPVASAPSGDPRQLYHTLPTRWGIDDATYVPPCPSPRPAFSEPISPERHRCARATAESEKLFVGGTFRLFD